MTTGNSYSSSRSCRCWCERSDGGWNYPHVCVENIIDKNCRGAIIHKFDFRDRIEIGKTDLLGTIIAGDIFLRHQFTRRVIALNNERCNIIFPIFDLDPQRCYVNIMICLNIISGTHINSITVPQYRVFNIHIASRRPIDTILGKIMSSNILVIK